MSLYKDKQGSLWLGTFNEGALFYNARQYLFRYHPLTLNINQPIRVTRKTDRGAGEIMDRT